MPITARDLPAFGVKTEKNFPKRGVAPKWSWVSQKVLLQQKRIWAEQAREQKNNKSSAQLRLEAQEDYDKRSKFNEKVSTKLNELSQYLRKAYPRIAKITDETVEDVLVIKGKIAEYSNKLNKNQQQTCSICGEILDHGTINKNYRYVCSGCAKIYGFKRGEKSLRIPARAKAIKDCGNNFAAYKCVNCGTHVIGNNVFTCDDKLCAHCAHNRSAKIKEKLSVIFGEYLKENGSTNKMRMLTLTIKNCQPGQLIFAIMKLRESFTKLRRRKIFADVKGGFYSIEITYNSTYDTWHPHIHCIIFSENNIPHKELSRIWHKITKDSMVVDIRHINVEVIKGDEISRDEISLAGGIAEVAKYITKLTVDKDTGEIPEVFNNPERLLELISAIYRLRQFCGFGDFYGLDGVLDKIIELEKDLEKLSLIHI